MIRDDSPELSWILNYRERKPPFLWIHRHHRIVSIKVIFKHKKKNVSMKNDWMEYLFYINEI